MKFIISTQELNSLINKVQSIIPQKPTMPILSNFLIEAFNNEITLTATDLMIGIRCKTEAQVIKEGATTLPAKRFAQLLRELTTPTIEFSTNSHEITTVISGTSRFKLNGMNREGYPSLTDLSSAQTLHIKQKDLKELLYRTSFAVSRDDTRYALSGVLMQISNGQILFAATDGKRLARAFIPIDVSPSFTTQSVIPFKASDELSKNLSDNEEEKIALSLMPDKIAFSTDQTLLLTKLLIGDYPDINRIIPEYSEINLSLHREELFSLLRQIALFTTDGQHSARFSFTNGELKLAANTLEVGEGDVGMPVNYQGEPLEIAFNPFYFIDILRHCKEETITLGLTDPYNPGLIVDGEITGTFSAASPLFVIMPMRLSED